MVDHLTKKKRSWNMSRIRSRNTSPEIIVRSIVHKMGFRYSLMRNDLPGKPDLTLVKYNTVIFVHGCFWHRHKDCRNATTPKSNTRFWKEKFLYNTKRDKKNLALLKKAGWKITIVWECELKKAERLKSRLQRLLRPSE